MNGIPCWAITSEEHVEAAVDTVKASIAKSNWLITKGARKPMNVTFVPESDDGPELEPKDITPHQEMIGMLRWATELGRVDILHEISISSQCQASPRENHMKQLLRIFSCLKRKCKLTLFMDPDLPGVDESWFSHDTSEFLECHRDAKEELPRKFPRQFLLGISMTLEEL